MVNTNWMRFKCRFGISNVRLTPPPLTPSPFCLTIDCNAMLVCMKALFCQSNCLKRFHELIDVRTAKLGNTSMEERKLPAEGTEARDAPPTVSNTIVLIILSSIYHLHHVSLGTVWCSRNKLRKLSRRSVVCQPCSARLRAGLLIFL